MKPKPFILPYYTLWVVLIISAVLVCTAYTSPTKPVDTKTCVTSSMQLAERYILSMSKLGYHVTHIETKCGYGVITEVIVIMQKD